MSQFPLYTTLMNNLPDKDLTVLEKKDLLTKISNVDVDTHELIYVLIKCFFIEHDKGGYLSIPYDGVISKNNIEFDLQKMPNLLRRLLYKFISLHKKKLVEDEKIKELQSHEL